MVRASLRHRYDVIDGEAPELEMHRAAVAAALLLAVENVLVGPVVLRRVDVGPLRGVLAGVTKPWWNRSPISERSRSFTNSTVLSDRSIPTQARPIFSAATHAVAHPQNGSSTISPSLDDALIMRSSKASGFCVG